ncbi:hypothetical protein QQX98_007133 [Neonectria punicea]|uniref:Uncharacterized protein n=1 Tax=Neonectria punicea TaxID=979145 RepID=A0ABR1GYQ0_9HYPO
MDSSQNAVLASYVERASNFDLEIDLGIKNLSDEDYNRKKISQQDLGSLSLISSLTRVQHGSWEDAQACLIGFRFQFHDGNAHTLRFRKAKMTIEFQARPVSSPDKDPAVINYGPKKMRAVPTEEQREWQYLGTISAKASMGAFQAGPEISAGVGGSYPRRYAAEIESDDWGDRKHRAPNCVKIWMHEDKKQEDGLPTELLAAVVITLDGPCTATVHVQADALFNIVAWPWTKDDPVLLQPGVGLGQPVGGTGNVDFSKLTDEDWLGLVTPGLNHR